MNPTAESLAAQTQSRTMQSGTSAYSWTKIAHEGNENSAEERLERQRLSESSSRMYVQG